MNIKIVLLVVSSLMMKANDAVNISSQILLDSLTSSSSSQSAIGFGYSNAMAERTVNAFNTLLELSREFSLSQDNVSLGVLSYSRIFSETVNDAFRALFKVGNASICALYYIIEFNKLLDDGQLTTLNCINKVASVAASYLNQTITIVNTSVDLTSTIITDQLSCKPLKCLFDIFKNSFRLGLTASVNLAHQVGTTVTHLFKSMLELRECSNNYMKDMTNEVDKTMREMAACGNHGIKTS